MPSHPLINFEIQNIIKMNQDLMVFILEIVYLLKKRMGAYIINLDECSDIGTHWVALYVSNNDVTYFNSFGVKHIPKAEYKHMIQ